MRKNDGKENLMGRLWVRSHGSLVFYSLVHVLVLVLVLVLVYLYVYMNLSETAADPYQMETDLAVVAVCPHTTELCATVITSNRSMFKIWFCQSVNLCFSWAKTSSSDKLPVGWVNCSIPLIRLALNWPNKSRVGASCLSSSATTLIGWLGDH